MVTNVEVDYVTAGLQGTLLGRPVQVETGREPDPRGEIRRHLLGPATEALILDDFDWHSWRSDMCGSAYFAALVPEEDDCLSYLADAFERARGEVAEPANWSGISALATALSSVESRKVEGGRALEIMRQVMEGPAITLPTMRASPSAGLPMSEHLSQKLTKGYVSGIMNGSDEWIRSRQVWPFIRVSTKDRARKTCESLGWSEKAAKILFRQPTEDRDSYVLCFELKHSWLWLLLGEEWLISKVIAVVQRVNRVR